MDFENGIVGEAKRVFDKVENGAKKQEKDVELVGKEEVEEVFEEKESEKAESNGEGEEEEVGEVDGEKAEENGEEEEEEKRGEKGVAKKRKGGSSVKEAPITPIGRPSRERKTVERYMELSDSRSSAGKALLIEKGKGMPLKDIPNVAFKLSKIRPDDNLKLLHSVLYGKRIKVQILKRNIGLFSGFVWDANEEKQRIKVKERIDRCVKDKLLLFCDILNIPVNKTSAKKEDLSAKLLEFLESPHVTTEKLLADSEKSKKLKRKAKSSKSPSSVRKVLKTASKKQKLESESGKKRKIPSKNVDEDDDEGERSESRDVSQDDDENDADAKKESDQDSKSEEEEEKTDADAKEESDQDSKSEEEEKNDADAKEESDQDSKSEEEEKNDADANEENDQDSKSEEEEEDGKGKPRRNLTSKKSSSKEVSKNDSGVQTADKTNSVKRARPTKSSKTTPKLTKKSLMSMDISEKNDTSAASGTSRKSKGPSTKKRKLDKEHEKDQSLSAKVKTSGKKESSKSSTKALAKDQGNKKGSQKAKPEPSKEEMHAVVADILKEVDFNTATLSDILRQLGTHFDVDLTHRKAEVKLIITDVISNMTDEDDDGEEDTGEDAEGDGEDDNNA